MLAGRFRDGDAAAFDRIVKDNRRAVYLMARRLLGSHEDADEAAQVAFVRAWQSRRTFRGTASLRTWLIRIALNVAKSMRSSRVEGEGLDGFAPIADATEDSEQRLGREQSRARVRAAVAALPPRQREVVVLKVFSDLTHREVAEIMGLSQGAVKAHLHQAVGNLRRRMSEEEEMP